MTTTTLPSARRRSGGWLLPTAYSVLRVAHQVAVGVVHRQRPERAHRRHLALGEHQPVAGVAVQGAAAGVQQGGGVDGLGPGVGAEPQQRDARSVGVVGAVVADGVLGDRPAAVRPPRCPAGVCRATVGSAVFAAATPRSSAASTSGDSPARAGRRPGRRPRPPAAAAAAGHGRAAGCAAAGAPARPGRRGRSAWSPYAVRRAVQPRANRRGPPGGVSVNRRISADALRQVGAVARQRAPDHPHAPGRGPDHPRAAHAPAAAAGPGDGEAAGLGCRWCASPRRRRCWCTGPAAGRRSSACPWPGAPAPPGPCPGPAGPWRTACPRWGPRWCAPRAWRTGG